MYNTFDCIKKGRKDLPTELTSELNKVPHTQRYQAVWPTDGCPGLQDAAPGVQHSFCH